MIKKSALFMICMLSSSLTYSSQSACTNIITPQELTASLKNQNSTPTITKFSDQKTGLRAKFSYFCSLFRLPTRFSKNQQSPSNTTEHNLQTNSNADSYKTEDKNSITSKFENFPSKVISHNELLCNFSSVSQYSDYFYYAHRDQFGNFTFPNINGIQDKNIKPTHFNISKTTIATVSGITLAAIIATTVYYKPELYTKITSFITAGK